MLLNAAKVIGARSSVRWSSSLWTPGSENTDDSRNAVQGKHSHIRKSLESSGAAQFAAKAAGKKEESEWGSGEVASVRNIGLMAHIDAGKTTTTERLLYLSSSIRRLGDVDTGTTTTDFLPMERERGITIGSAAVSYTWPPESSSTVHVIDTPGHVDFTVEVERALRVTDGGIVVFDGVAGVEAQSFTVWGQADRYRLPRIAFVNKLDRAGANFSATVQAISTKLQANSPLNDNNETGLVAPVQLPLYAVQPDSPTGTSLVGFVDLINLEVVVHPHAASAAAVNTAGTSPSAYAPVVLGGGLDALTTRTGPGFKFDPDSTPSVDQVMEAQMKMFEAVAAGNGDFQDHLLERIMEDESPDVEEVKKALRAGVVNRTFIPAMSGSAARVVGVHALLDAISAWLPSPLEVPAVKGVAEGKEVKRYPRPSFAANDKEKLAALAFKVTMDSGRGATVFVRVYSGVLKSRAVLWNTTQGVRERAARVVHVTADHVTDVDSVGAGYIAAVIGLKHTKTGDTLVSSGEGSRGPVLEGISIPPPVFMCSIEPETSADAAGVETALAALLREDPSAEVREDSSTGQTLLAGMGELHLEVLTDRLVNGLGAKATRGPVQIAYRETVTGSHGVQEWSLDRPVGTAPAGCVSLSLRVEPLADVPQEGDEALDDANNVLSWAWAPARAWLSGATAEEQAESGGGEEAELPVEDVISAVTTAVSSAVGRGPLLGVPMQGVRVVVDEVSTGVGASAPAVQASVAMAMREAANGSNPVLLEPMMDVGVMLPEEYLGPVLAELTSVRRATVTGIEEDADAAGTPGARTIQARVPLSQLIGYAAVLRGLTKGTGSFDSSFVEYGQMDSTVQKETLVKLRGF